MSVSSGNEDEKIDDFDLIINEDTGLQWKDKTASQRLETVLMVLLKLVVLLGLMYLFICSLGLLTDAFRLLGGKAAGEAFRQNEILSNPIADLMMGVLVTVLLQSSSTTTSIVVSMVAAEVLPVRPAIFIVMGANIGTSVTNTIVSMGQIYDPEQFKRAFAGATVHDMFNWLSVLILLPIEWLSGSFGSWYGCGLLCQLTGQMVKHIPITKRDTKKDFLKAITKPFLDSIIKLDKNKIQAIALARNGTVPDVGSLVKHDCKAVAPVAVFNATANSCYIDQEEVTHRCDFMFENISNYWTDAAVGGCLLLFAVFILMVCLVAIVKLLHSMLRGAVARIIQRTLNARLPGYFGWLTGYLTILIGTGATMLVQSSSIFTSALTPLVGAGVLHLKRMYPLTLGANIGTTFTAILASLANKDADTFRITLQVALCHLFFNILGILIWYPVPYMRNVPIGLAKRLGRTTSRHRWFAAVYLFLMFFAAPGGIFAISLAGWVVSVAVLVPLFVILVLIVVLNVIQRKRNHVLPAKLRDWSFLPAPCHSLSFYDRLFAGCLRCCVKKQKDGEADQGQSEEVGEADNQACKNCQCCRLLETQIELLHHKLKCYEPDGEHHAYIYPLGIAEKKTGIENAAFSDDITVIP